MSREQKEHRTGVEGWQSYHLFYHDNLDAPLLTCVKPVVGQLYRLGWIEKFFFIRYGLGGPHIRLRLLPQPGCSEQVRDFIEQEVSAFLSRSPSLHPRSEAAIRRENKTLLTNDAHELEDAVYPDNSLIEFPFIPETERYGGPALLDHSLDFFVFSSIATLSVLEDYSAQQKGRQISTVTRYLLRLALGFAESAKEFGDLLGYGVEWSRNSLPDVILLADNLYERQKNVMRQLIESEIERAARPATVEAVVPADFWTRVADCFAGHISSAAAPLRESIFRSHLHMTANRFGLKNTDEFYLSRLVCRAVAEMAETDGAALAECFSSREKRSVMPLRKSQAGLPHLFQTAFGLLSVNHKQPI